MAALTLSNAALTRRRFRSLYWSRRIRQGHPISGSSADCRFSATSRAACAQSRIHIATALKQPHHVDPVFQRRAEDDRHPNGKVRSPPAGHASGATFPLHVLAYQKDSGPLRQCVLSLLEASVPVVEMPYTRDSLWFRHISEMSRGTPSARSRRLTRLPSSRPQHRPTSGQARSRPDGSFFHTHRVVAGCPTAGDYKPNRMPNMPTAKCNMINTMTNSSTR